uniref:Helix-turn-helix n=1 Tax=Candidatus Kentrum sp. FW TaxID=2126338 RepID=A0A450SLG7_9GAMM|nr:MAG: hypothetical protein BECKFW1821B_GA0114236_101914 [Candidatus Kentron sp. FW]
MREDKKGRNANRRPFKQTRDLVRLALHDGWTQKEIADKCRTQQSVVSAWNRGAKLATEKQLKPLLEIYGYKLRRNSFRVYWSINTETNEKTFCRVEGKVIFSQSFNDPRRENYKLVKRIPIYKLVVHHQGGDQFLVILQNRFIFEHTNEELECSTEDGIWTSSISGPKTCRELIEFVDKYSVETLEKFPCDANTLPFLIRRALLNHGFPIEGIVEYPAIW